MWLWLALGGVGWRSVPVPAGLVGHRPCYKRADLARQVSSRLVCLANLSASLTHSLSPNT